MLPPHTECNMDGLGEGPVLIETEYNLIFMAEHTQMPRAGKHVTTKLYIIVYYRFTCYTGHAGV